jgi:hypothetical protein
MIPTRARNHAAQTAGKIPPDDIRPAARLESLHIYVSIPPEEAGQAYK